MIMVAAVATGLLFIAIGKVNRSPNVGVDVNVDVTVNGGEQKSEPEPPRPADLPTSVAPPRALMPPETDRPATSPVPSVGSKPTASSDPAAVAPKAGSLRATSASGFVVIQDEGILGEITLLGNPPKEVNLPLDPACGIAYRKLNATGKPTTRFYAMDTEGGLADVFVTLVGVKGKFTANGLEPVTIDQRGCEYLPYVSACLTGQTIRVLNSDPVLHNVHTIPSAKGNPEGNRAHLPNAPPLTFVYSQPEEFLKFKCDVHPWMFSYVSIVSHPHFGVSDSNGNFSISKPAPGKYTLRVHHRKLGTQEREIEILGTGGIRADFEFKIEE
jgi:hypothetical protein